MKNSISVNMTPNPLDYQTLHCSQNDTSLRKFKFTLHNQGEAVETSSISDPVFSSFTEYEGGTEELLPTNSSTPSTSPILADIQYSDGLREDQSFTYRESPVTKDGKAKVNVLKGNSLVWNQQLLAPTVSGGSNASADGSFRSNRCTFTYDSSTHISTITALENTGTSGFLFGTTNGAPLVIGHKYLQMCDVQAPKVFNFAIGTNDNADTKTNLSANTYHRVSTIKEFGSSSNEFRFNFNSNNGWAGTETVYIKNTMLIDLTQMFGAGNEPTADDFKSLFPLPYYQYDSGSMLDFKGTGIKTVGRNLLPPSTSFANIEEITIDADNGVYTLNGTAPAYRQLIATNSFVIEPGTYRFSRKTNITNDGVTVQLRSVDGLTTYAYAATNSGVAFTLADRTELKFRIVINANAGTLNNFIIKPMLELGSVATDFEPYTESTTSLPTLTYFPTGMKSAGNVYDELTSNKAVTRVGQVDLGTLTWVYDRTVPRFYSTGIASLSAHPIDNDHVANIIGIYKTVSFNELYATSKENQTMALGNTGTVSIININYTDATAFKTAMSGVMLNYELATPSEQSITSASLVTINGESDLYTDGEDLVCDCNEDISKESGYFDAKLRFTDADGTNYSNKFELHVERSPQ